MKTNILSKVGLMVAIVAPLALTSCSDDFLKVTPPDRATNGEYFSTAEHITENIIATYNPMRVYDFNYDRIVNGSGMDGQYSPLNMCSDVMGDDVWVGGSSSSDNRHLHLMANFASTQNSGDALMGIWRQSYRGIRNANDVLVFTEESKANLTNTQYNLFTAEAKVLRAFYYCQLWKFYGNIPYFTKNMTSNYAANQLGHDEIYNNVITELADAIDGGALPMKRVDAEVGRVSKAMAEMLFAEMVMYQNDESRYSKALGYMQEIINSGSYALAADYAGIFLESGEWSSESIFEINYKDDNGIRSWNGGYINAGGSVYPRLISPADYDKTDGIDAGWGFEPVRQECYDMFNEKDARRDATIYHATGKYTKRYQNTGLWLKKYIAYTENNKDQKADADLNFNNNLRIYRYAETLLNAAELIVRTNGDAAKAQEYLNLVHHRAGLTDNVAANIDNIINERHLEFVGEGKRYWDLVRTGKAKSTLVPDEYGYRTNTWSESKKYLPIPLTEIDASEGTLTQNNY